MDALGVAAAVLALAVYPGGAALLVVGWSAWRLAGGKTLVLNTLDVVAVALLDVGVALAPLPGSPISSLPPGSGVAPNLVVMAVVFGIAVACAASGRWTRDRTAAVAAAAASAAVLAIAAASVSLPGIAGLPGPAMLAARISTAVSVLAAGAAVAAMIRSGLTRAMTVAGFAVAGLSVLVPAGVTGWRGACAAVLVETATVVLAIVVMRSPRHVRMLLDHPGIFGAVACAAATASVVVGAVA
ncbi:MAG: hypothetical protein ABR498_08785 [Candidatus Dormibacteria bacterium]